MNVKIKRLRSDAKIPTRGTDSAAGYDLYADVTGVDKNKVTLLGSATDKDSQQSILIWPGETIMIPTGIAVEIPDGYFGAIYPRSGLATKKGLRLANCVAVIDSDYRGEVFVAIHSDANVESVIAHGERIAQIVIQPYLAVEWDEVEGDLTETARGSGGFGSTGAK